jgi:alpha-tubulin suppressor-like RCC1 family protein
MFLLLYLCCVARAGGAGTCSIDRLTAPDCKRCARAVALGHYHSCVHLYDNSVECAGQNHAGQMGLGTQDWDERLVLVPASVLTGISVKSVGCGEAFTCVLAAAVEGSLVYCFGSNNGVLGTGVGPNELSSATPVVVQGLKHTPNIAQLAVRLPV